MTLGAVVGSWTDERLWQHADELKTLRSLVVYGQGFTDRGAELLTRCPDLKELHLVETDISDEGLRNIGRIRSLDWLVLDHADVSDEGMKHLSDLQALNGLQIIETNVRDEGFWALLQLPRLSYLETIGQNIKDNAISVISLLPALEVLRISSPSAQDTDFLNFTFSRSLKSISFDMPNVSREAIDQVLARIPGCELTPFFYYKPHDKILYLANYCFDMLGLEEYELARSAADDFIEWAPFNPAIRGTRALINFKMGNFYEFRKDLERARLHAEMRGEHEFAQLADQFLAVQSPSKLHKMIEEHNLKQVFIDKLSLSAPALLGFRAQSQNQRAAGGEKIADRGGEQESVIERVAGSSDIKRVIEEQDEYRRFLRRLRDNAYGAKVPWQW